MKKFLSLVLALIMTMSLVTISAGATEYRDLTDKDEIQYEEAVAVLNRIGVITGYEDGSFRPEGELTRGAAAKIIVSLLIGPEAASNLPNTTAPYPDVPASHTFAGVISYCKTAKIISGYGDGTFKPGNSLTGFAFAKMLLGALGYKQEIEGFVDTGWTMNVAKVGNVTGLFDRLDFDGAAAVNRETACQLALNTLKATMVTYGGTTVVTGAQALAVQGTQAMYVTSNNREINANINRRVISAQNNEMTLEFGEEHFKDLRLEHDKYDPAYDNFGRPSNQWSWKKVTIGTFPLPADFTYTNQISYREDSVATKEKALGLRGYDTYSTDHQANYTNWSSAAGGSYAYNSPFDNATQITINGYDARANAKTGVLYDYDASKVGNKDAAPTLEEIADLTDNGVTVEVYVCPVDADFITNVVVVRTQLMKVKRIGSDYVTLEDIEPDSRDPRKAGDLPAITGYNAFAIDVNTVDVKDDNYDAYNTLKDLKAGDYVAVVPFTADQNKTWEVGEAYVPETVSGRLSDVGLYMNTSKADGNAVSITIGGTKYVINEWNADMIDVKKAQINATRKDVTGYLAADGTVLWATEIGNSDAWMIVGDYYQAANTSGKVVWFAHGWTIGGEEVDIDLGTIRQDAEKYAPGELVRYQLASGGTGEYELVKPNNNGVSYWYNHTQGANDGKKFTEPQMKDKDGNLTGEGIYNVAQFVLSNTAAKPYEIHAANSLIPLENYSNYKTTGAPTGPANGGAIYNTEKDANLDGVADTGDTLHAWNYRSTTYKDAGVKFIYVSFDPTNGNVDYISTRKDAQNVSTKELAGQNTAWTNSASLNSGSASSRNWVVSPAEAYVNKDGNVEAVVIKSEPAVADLSNVVIITKVNGLAVGKNTGVDETSAVNNANNYEYVQGPNFDEAKTGWFKGSHSVGDILVIRSTDADGKMDCKYVNSGTYDGRNPDVIKAAGIGALRNAQGEKSKIAFYVGGKYGTVTNQKGNALSLDEALLKNLKVEAEDILVFDETQVQNGYAGLIKIAGAQWIDLRSEKLQRETMTVESLGDLLDLDPSTVKVNVLLNANSETDNFRRAYAVVVMDGLKSGSSDTTVTGYTITPSQAADATFLSDAFKNYDVVIVDNKGLSAFDISNYRSGKVIVPSNKTLRFTGDVLNTSQFTLGVNSKLIADGNLVIDTDVYAANSITAKTATVNDTVKVAGTVNVTNATTIPDGATVTINGKYTTGSIVKSSGVSGSTIDVFGTLTVGTADATNGDVIDGVTINVYSTSSLHVYGNVKANVTITAGNGSSASRNGRVTISGSMKGGFVDNNVRPTTGSVPTQDIAKVEGALTMSAASKLTTEKFAPTTVTLAVGATIVLEKGTDSSIVGFTDGTTVKDTGSKPATIVVGTAANNVDCTGGGATITGTVTDADGKPAAGTATVQLENEVTNVDVMANGKKLTTSAQNFAEGKITLSHSTLQAGKVMNFTVVKADDPTEVTVTNNAFDAVAGKAYTVTATVVDAPVEGGDTPVEITAVTVAAKSDTKILTSVSDFASLPAATAFEITAATPASGDATAAKNAVEITGITKWERQESGGSTWTDVTSTTNPFPTLAAGDTFRATLSIGIKSGSTSAYQLASALNGSTTATVVVSAS